MNEQVLKDLVATAQADGYSWDTITPKFPELAKFDEQVLKDYVATAEQDNYDYSKINSKFPEFEFEEISISDPVKKPVISETIDIEALKESKAKDFEKGIFLTAEREAKDKFDLTGEVDINLLSEESLNPEKSLLLDYGSQFANSILKLSKGGESLKTMGNMLAAKYAMDIFKPEYSDKEKALVIEGIKRS